MLPNEVQGSRRDPASEGPEVKAAEPRGESPLTAFYCLLYRAWVEHFPLYPKHYGEILRSLKQGIRLEEGFIKTPLAVVWKMH